MSRKKIVSPHSPATNVLGVTGSVLTQQLSVLLEDGLNATPLGRQKILNLMLPRQTLSELSSLVSRGDKNLEGQPSTSVDLNKQKGEGRWRSVCGKEM